MFENSDNNEKMDTENDEKIEMGDFSSNLDGYSSSKVVSRKEEVEESHDKNTGLDTHGEEEEKLSDHPQNASKEKMEEETGKEMEDIDPIGKDAKLSFLHSENLKADSSL